MIKPSFRDLSMHAMYGEIRCSIIAEGVSWSPDVANDMVRRMQDLWNGTLTELYRFDMLDTTGNNDDEEDDEYGPTPDKELIDPRVVRLGEEDFNG
jgi:hypothetical protein